MSSTQVEVGAGDPAPDAARWLDDLAWHRKMFDQARTRWLPETAVDIVTFYTRGRIDFSTVEDLRVLQHFQYEVAAYADQPRFAMDAPLGEVLREFGHARFGEALEAIGMDQVEWEMLHHHAVWNRGRTKGPINPDVADSVRDLPWSNPLTQAWELRQVWSLGEAALNLLEDAICDLVAELWETREHGVLCEATGTWDADWLWKRVDDAREARGMPGDPRRVPRQVFPDRPLTAVHAADRALRRELEETGRVIVPTLNR